MRSVEWFVDGIPSVNEPNSTFVQAIKRIYVNLVDLEHAGHHGNIEVVRPFPTEVALSEYTKSSEKFYWRDSVPRGSLLKLLLRHIWNPRPEKVETSCSRKRVKRSKRP
jgi:hypothetical protein